MQLTHNTVTRLLSCSTTAELSRVADVLFAEFGACNWMYAFERAGPSDVPERHWLGNYPVAWVEHYQAQGYPEVDPTVLHVVQHASPFFWPDHRRLPHDTHSLALPENRIFLEAHEHGLNGGITVPLNSWVRWGLLSLSFERFRDSVDANRRIFEIFYVAHQLHEAALSLFFPGGIRNHLASTLAHESRGEAGGSTDLPRLSSRELECLALAAEGFTSEQISERVGRKYRSVTETFMTIHRKLGVRSRKQAVALAIKHGLVQPPVDSAGLVPLELECLKLAASGMSSHEIADRVNRSYRSVTEIFLTITRKLAVPNRQAAVATALVRNIIQI